MTCANPQKIYQRIESQGSAANITLEHCDDGGFIYLSVEFEPKKVGAAVYVQGGIWIEGHRGPKFVTKKVEFHDDGRVLGVGDISNGVRFKQRGFDLRSLHTAIITSSFKNRW